MVCSGPNCGRTSDRIAEEFEVQIKIAGLRQEIQVIRGSCMGLCSSGPNVIMFPEGTIYSHVQIQDAARIVNEHLLKGNRVEELLYDETKVTNTTRGLDQTEFFQRQTRVALRNCGVIDPQNIEEYIAVDGYAALYKVLTEMSPDEVIDTVLESGLQGRGGAGFPTGMKWKFASGNRGQVQKYVCCNADEGDPGAFMDRSILEGNPHTVIEAMAIAAYAIGADKGYIYVRAEYPVAVKHLSIAIEQAKERVSPRILDLCCGSGCIGIAAAHTVEDARVTAIDLSDGALHITRENARDLGVSSRLLTMKADVMHAPPRGLGQFDIIVSNPPYVTEDEMQMLDRSVADFEPHEALYGGEDGLDFYHAICDSWGELLVPNGRLLFECGWHQADDVAGIMQRHGYKDATITEDYSGVPRIVYGTNNRPDVDLTRDA